MATAYQGFGSIRWRDPTRTSLSYAVSDSERRLTT
jgi:hypothetical protein